MIGMSKIIPVPQPRFTYWIIWFRYMHYLHFISVFAPIYDCQLLSGLACMAAAMMVW